MVCPLFGNYQEIVSVLFWINYGLFLVILTEFTL